MRLILRAASCARLSETYDEEESVRTQLANADKHAKRKPGRKHYPQSPCRLCLFSNSVPMDCAPRTECPVLAHAAFRRGLIAHSVQGAIQDGAPPTCLAAGEQPGPAAAACRGALRGRFPLLRHADPDHGAGGRFTGGQGGGRPRSAPSHQVLRAGGMGVCVAGLGAVRPRGWPSGRWMGGVRGMGYRGGAGPGPAPPPSLSGAVYGGDLVRGLGDHVGLAGDAELAESGQDPGLDERAEQLFAVPHVGHAQNAVAERGDVKTLSHRTERRLLAQPGQTRASYRK